MIGRWLPRLMTVAAAVSVFTACSSDKRAEPKHYDAVVFLCPNPPMTKPCTHPAREVEVAAVRSKLTSDPAVRDVVYVSPAQAIELSPYAKEAGLSPGDLPVSFTVRLADPGDFRGFAARYEHLDGVQVVVTCGKQPVCREAALRRVGAIE